MKRRDQFLKSLIGTVKALTEDEQSYDVKGPDQPIEWVGQPKNLWPKADIIIKLPHHQILVETDEDSDPCRSLIKYWPYLDKTSKNMPYEKVTLIGIWKKGSTIGQGYFELAKFVGKKFEKIFPGFSYIPKERCNETATEIARWIIEVLSKIEQKTSRVPSSKLHVA